MTARRARRTWKTRFAPSTARRGMSIVEVVVAVTIFACGLLGLAGAAGRGLAQTSMAQRDMQYAMDVQQVTDSLVGLGWGKVATDSAMIRGRPISWTVTSLGANSQLLTATVQRYTDESLTKVTQDTVTVYLAKPTPGS
jgi:type II secretory pathway pseudopilin PulG